MKPTATAIADPPSDCDAFEDFVAPPVWKLGEPYPDGWQDAALVAPSLVNPRRGDIRRLEESIRANGWWGVLIVQRHSPRQNGPRILVGNHRFKAGTNLGMERFPIQWVECDDTEGDRILLADNRYGDFATWDDPELLARLDDLLAQSALDGTGYTEMDVEALRASLMLPDEPPDPHGNAGLDVRITVGTIEFTVSRVEWNEWEQQLIDEVGKAPAEQVSAVRVSLGL